MVVELEIKKFREEVRREFAELHKLISGRGILGNWVKQSQACTMLGVKPRQLRNLRIHLDKNQKKVGSIRWRRGAGKTVEYHKADLERYLNAITIS